MTTKAFYIGYVIGGASINVDVLIQDSTGANTGCIEVPLTTSFSSTGASIVASVPAAVNAWCSANEGFVPDSAEWLMSPTALGVTKSFSTPSRSLNTGFQPSTTQDTVGLYSVAIASALTLTGGQQGSIILEYADDSSFTTNVKTCAELTNGNTGTLTIGLNTLQTYGGVLSGIIPAGKYARLRTSTGTGSPTYSDVTTQEVQF